MHVSIHMHPWVRKAQAPTLSLAWPESSMKPPISPLCTWQGKVIQCKCIDPRGLIQLDEDPGRVITFHRQRSRCCNTGLSGRLGADSQCWQEKQQIMVRLSWTSSGNWREIQWALKEMLPYSKPTVSLGDDYRLGCVVKCIKRHKMKISMCLPLTSRNTTPDSRGTRAWDWKWYGYPVKVSGGKPRINLDDVCLLSKLTFY